MIFEFECIECMYHELRIREFRMHVCVCCDSCAEDGSFLTQKVVCSRAYHRALAKALGQSIGDGPAKELARKAYADAKAEYYSSACELGEDVD